MMSEAARRKSILERLSEVDGSGNDAERGVISGLRDAYGDISPYLLERYFTASRWKVRSTCVYHAMFECRRSGSALELGKIALVDRSYPVRYAACKLLAVSQNPTVLRSLESAALMTSDQKTTKDIKAAITAITERDHNLFVDRERSGKATLNVQGVT